MFVQVADAEPSESTAVRTAVADRPADEELAPARGIATAVILSAPAWALLTVTLYLVL